MQNAPFVSLDTQNMILLDPKKLFPGTPYYTFPKSKMPNAPFVSQALKK